MKFLGTLLGDEEEWKGLALHDIHVDVFVEKEDFIKWNSILKYALKEHLVPSDLIE